MYFDKLCSLPTLTTKQNILFFIGEAEHKQDRDYLNIRAIVGTPNLVLESRSDSHVFHPNPEVVIGSLRRRSWLTPINL